MVLSGVPNLCATIFLGFLFLYLAFGLWRLQEKARRLAIGYEGYLLLNVWLTIANPSVRAPAEKLLIRLGVEIPPAILPFAFVASGVAVSSIPMLCRKL